MIYSQQFHEYQQNYNNSLSPQTIEHKKEHNICPCVKPVNGIQSSINWSSLLNQSTCPICFIIFFINFHFPTSSISSLYVPQSSLFLLWKVILIFPKNPPWFQIRCNPQCLFQNANGCSFPLKIFPIQSCIPFPPL